jgi:hypothetical protein
VTQATWWRYVMTVTGNAAQKDIATATGIDQSSISRWQRGTNTPSADAVASDGPRDCAAGKRGHRTRQSSRQKLWDQHPMPRRRGRCVATGSRFRHAIVDNATFSPESRTSK